MSLVEQVASNEILELAFAWLCKRRGQASHNNDVWILRSRWDETKPQLQRELRVGCYKLSPTRRWHIEGEVLEVWSAQDALVLKAVSIVLERELHGVLSPRCFHLAGRGGAKRAVSEVFQALPKNRFVFRTDVKSYYATIDHSCLIELLQKLVPDADVIALVAQYIHRTVSDGGIYHDVKKGICLGCSLSPLMGAVYLKPIDDAMKKSGLFYARFMDDWVILAPTRWKLRAAIRIVNQCMTSLKVEKHPQKTFIGLIQRGFDFLGYVLHTNGIRAANKTVKKAIARVRQLYEQGVGITRIDDYVRRWQRWFRSGLTKSIKKTVTFSFPSAIESDDNQLRQLLASTTG